MPEFVIGDMDSVDAATLAEIPATRIVRIAEQETTDFEKCLSRIEAPLILGVGFSGGRTDHQLAAFNAMVRYPERRVVLVGRREICFHLPPELRLELSPGTRVSLFPMAPVSGGSDGLRWPIDGIGFAPDGRIGTSNVTVDPVLRLSMAGPGMLAIMPRAVLDAVVPALSR